MPPRWPTVNARASCAGGVCFKQRFKWFATASKSTQVAVLPWRYDAELGAMTRSWAPQIRYTLRRNTASMMKGLVLV